MANDPGIITNNPYSTVPQTLGASEDDTEIVNILESYRKEAENARSSGQNPRDDVWERNIDMYWNRYDFSGKAKWQAQETMPEVPAFVDRFAAAMKEALVSSPSGFYTVHDPADTENDMTDAIKRMTDVWLSAVGRNQSGAIIGFPAVFEEQMKLGAITATSAVVTWKNDVKYGRVAMETVDPRNIWIDHTYRNLYRIRQIELDKHDLIAMAKQTNSKGEKVFNESAIQQLIAEESEKLRQHREEGTGTGQDISSTRQPVKLHEYIATVVNNDGEVVAENELMVVANNKFLIRGPDKNPFWHGRDWLVYSPLVTAPLSVYGRTYMEDFGSLANTFTELTNLILDAVHTSAINAYVMVPDMLVDPTQAVGGIHPNKTFFLETGYSAKDFASALELGNLDAGAVQVWQNIKSELSEAAGINEVGLGQFAPNSRTSATEIMQTQQSSSAIVRSVAQTVETRFLDLMLDLVWKTGLQHAKRNDPMLRRAVGEDMWYTMYKLRRDLISRPITFQARGISQLIQRSQMLAQLLQLMQIVAQNENLLAAFMQVVDLDKLVQLLMKLSNIDPYYLKLTPREAQIKQLLQPALQRAAGGTPSAAGTEAMSQATGALGIRRAA